MTLAFVYYLWWKHLRGAYGTTRRAVTFFAVLWVAYALDGSDVLELIGAVVVRVGPIAWQRLTG